MAKSKTAPAGLDDDLGAELPLGGMAAEGPTEPEKAEGSRQTAADAPEATPAAASEPSTPVTEPEATPDAPSETGADSAHPPAGTVIRDWHVSDWGTVEGKHQPTQERRLVSNGKSNEYEFRPVAAAE